MSGRRRQGGGSRTGTILVLAGIAGVLTATFVAGIWTGRHWPLLTGEARPGMPAESTAARQGPAERPKQAQPLPALTFYQELTAPLTAPPPPVARNRSAAAKPPAERGRGEPEPRPAAGGVPPDERATPAAEAFTVQVGAYRARTPAEALRTMLAAAGYDARVAEAEAPAGVRYRVHVGVFPTRDAARDTATRLGREHSLPAFVTAR
jgi:cell division protein FtsN